MVLDLGIVGARRVPNITKVDQAGAPDFNIKRALNLHRESSTSKVIDIHNGQFLCYYIFHLLQRRQHGQPKRCN